MTKLKWIILTQAVATYMSVIDMKPQKQLIKQQLLVNQQAISFHTKYYTMSKG